MRLRPESSLSIDLRRFGNQGASHRFGVGEVEGLSTTIDHLNHRLTVSASGETRGLKRLPLYLLPKDAGGERFESSLPLVVEPVTIHRFFLPGYESADSVSVVGGFNSWNTGASVLERVDGGWAWSGTFDPGRYAYKYVIDGNWVADPENSEREPDGYGGHNSILRVESEPGSGAPPMLIVRSVGETSIRLTADGPVGEVLAEVLPEEGGTIGLPVRVEDRQIFVKHAGLAPQGALVRVLAASPGGEVALPAITFAGEPQKDIWQDDIIYYAFTDRFYDGDPSNTQPVDHPAVLPPANYQGGDFAGIRQKLEEGYFDELGVNVLWLAPLNQNPDGAWQEYLPPFRHYTGYHGYWPVTRYGVERRFGGEAALHELLDEARASEVKVLADFVLKHIHIENPIREERPELLGRLELADGTRNLRRWNDNPFTTWFEPFLPAFDFRNPDSIAFLLEDAVHWMETYGLDGYRLDAVKHIRPDFWWRFRTVMRDTFPGSNHYYVGETFHDRHGIADFVGPNMLDGQFDFPLYDTLLPCFAQGTVGFGDLEQSLRQSETVYGRSVRMSALLGNHDKSRFMAYADGDLPDPEEPDAEEVGWATDLRVDDPAAYGKLKMAMTFLMTIDGVPMIYYGDEIGMTGAGDPDNRRMMRFGDDVTADEAAVKDHFSRLAHTRRAHPALYLGSRRPLVVEDEHYAYVRAYEEDVALVAFNRSSETRHFNLDLRPEVEDIRLVDVIGGSKLNVANGRASFSLPPMKSLVFVPEDAAHAD
jgi:glycosidase